MTEDQQAMFEALKGPLKRSVEQAVSEALQEVKKDVEALTALTGALEKISDELEKLNPEDLAWLRGTRGHSVRQVHNGEEVKEVDVLAHLTNSAWTFRTLKIVAKAYAPLLLGVSGWLVWFMTTDFFQTWWASL